MSSCGGAGRSEKAEEEMCPPSPSPPLRAPKTAPEHCALAFSSTFRSRSSPPSSSRPWQASWDVRACNESYFQEIPWAIGGIQGGARGVFGAPTAVTLKTMCDSTEASLLFNREDGQDEVLLGRLARRLRNDRRLRGLRPGRLCALGIEGGDHGPGRRNVQREDPRQRSLLRRRRPLQLRQHGRIPRVEQARRLALDYYMA